MNCQGLGRHIQRTGSSTFWSISAVMGESLCMSQLAHQAGAFPRL